MPAYQKEKLCPDCGRTLPRSAFYSKGKSKMDGKSYLTTRCKEHHRAWRKANRATETESVRRWRRKHQDAWNAYMREWRKKHPGCDEHRAVTYRQYNSRLGRGRLYRLEWETIVENFGYVCAYCGSGGPLEVDHFLPISQGGANDITNFVPACRSCNASKGDMPPTEFLAAERYAWIVKVLSSYG